LIARGKILKSQAQKKRSLYQANGQKIDRATKKKRLENGEQITEIGDHNRNAGPCGITDLLVAAAAAGIPLGVGQMKTVQSLQPTQSRNQNCKKWELVPNSTISKKDQIAGRLYRQVCIKYRQGHCPRGKDCTNKHAGKMVVYYFIDKMH